MKYCFLFVFTCLVMPSMFAQTNPSEISLYENKIPNEIPGNDMESSSVEGGMLRISNVRNPTLSIFLSSKEKATGTAVIICPGGGYWILAADHEGSDVAKKFNEMGVAAFVLKYRLPDTLISPNPSIAPLQDAQQAIKTVRMRAKEWNIDPEKIGILGFSAGGHVASTAGTHFQKSYIDNPENIDLRPDFMMLIYPVISGNEEISHKGSFEKLLGKGASKYNIEEFSNELHVTPKTPPTFLVHASDDKTVNPENSIIFYQQLVKNNVPAEIHIYQAGGHGFGMHNATTSDEWIVRAKHWLESNQLLGK